MNRRQYLFVYGSLRRQADGQRHPLLERYAEYLGEASVVGRLYRVADYHGAVLAADGGLIRGEVYGLSKPDWVLCLADQYEECSPMFPQPQEYCRCLTEARLAASGVPFNVWIYAYNRPVTGLTQIASGDWLATESS